MKELIALLGALLLCGCGGTFAKSTVDRGATLYPPNNGNICMLAGSAPPDVQYEVLGRIVATKRTYGSSDELFPPMAREARMLGADAIINIQASQRFKGPLPWRITSPTGDGQAIKVLPESVPIDCVQLGGKLWGPGGNEVTVANEDPVVAINEDAAPTVDWYSEILKLDELRKNGLLTDAEFEAEKKELLGRN